MTLCKSVQGSEGPIHSGHFMISEVHNDQENNEDYDASDDNPFRRRRNSVYKYVRGNVTFFIDRTLNNLFRCLDLAYSGKIPSPRWNVYKDLKLSVKDCIRLNNLIWREWFKQCLLGHKPVVCNLTIPNKAVSDKRPEVVLLEGKYWRRSQQSIQTEYRRWRLAAVIARNCRCRHLSAKYNTVQRTPDSSFRPQGCGSTVGHIATSNSGTSSAVMNSLTAPTTANSGMGPPTPLSTFCDYDDDDNMWVADFSDTLFANLCNNLFEFPDPKYLGPLGNADLIQPGLMQLQPLNDSSPKTPPFLCDLQPATQTSSSWQPETDSPLPFLGSLGRRGAHCATGAVNDVRPQQTLLPGVSYTNNVVPIQNQNVEMFASDPQNSQIIDQRSSIQGNTPSSSVSVAQQQQPQQHFSITSDPSIIYQQISTLGAQIQPSYASASTQQSYLTQGPISTSADQFIQVTSHGQHQNGQKMPNDIVHQQSQYFIPAPSSNIEQSFVAVSEQVPLDNVNSSRRRHRSGADDNLQQQQQSQPQRIMNSYNTSSNANPSAPNNSLARYNPTVASLLQSTSSSALSDAVTEPFGKFPLNGLSRNNSNLMLLSAAASVAASSTLPSGYVDSISTASLAPCLLNSTHSSGMHHDLPKDAIKDIARRSIDSSSFASTSELQSKPQPVLRLSTKSTSAAVGSYLISSSTASASGNDVPVVLSNVQRRSSSTPWNNQDSNPSIHNSNAPLTPLTADQMSSGSGLPPKKRPRSEMQSNDSVMSTSSSAMSHLQFQCKLSPSITGCVSDMNVTMASSMPSASSNGSSLLHQRLKYGTATAATTQQQQQQQSQQQPQSHQQQQQLLPPPNISIPDASTPNASVNNARRRMVHIVCESRRRSAITSAMERLSELLPESFAPQSKPNSANHGSNGSSTRGRRAGLSQAALLCYVARFLDELSGEVSQLSQNFSSVRDQIDEISLDVSRLQSSLPLLGACKSGGSTVSTRFGTSAGQRSRAVARFDAFIARKSQESWKFVLLSNLFKPLYLSFLDVVKIDIVSSSTSKSKTVVLDMASLREWITQACSLPALRQASSQLLLELARTSPILVAPEQLPTFLIQSVKR